MYKIIGADQKEYGPVTADQLRQWIAEGRINAQTLLQAEGQTDWRPLSSYPEFAAAATAAPAPGVAPIMPPTSAAASLVSGPATGLMIVGILCVLSALWSLFANLLGWGGLGAGRRAADIPPQLQRLVELTSGGAGVALAILGLAVSAFILFAAAKMRKLESYGLVMTATIVSMLPCLSPCCCAGIPIGIWILVVLSKPEVKAAFH